MSGPRRPVGGTLQSAGVGASGVHAAKIRAMAPWFHNLHLPDGSQTAPDHPLGDFPAFKWAQFGDRLPADMTGMRVLDIGCNAGFYSLALAARGASVLAIDVDPHYLRQAAWAREQHGFSDAQISLREMQVYDLADLDERFDVVLFLGVLYHLRYPLLALDIVAERVGGTLVLQTLTMPGEVVAEVPSDLGIDEREAMLADGWPKMAFIERRLAGDATNWWAPNHACVEAMVRSAGLEVTGAPGHEIVLARRAPGQDDDSVSERSHELRAVLGRRRG